MEGGVTMDSVNAVRTVHGTSPTAELEFTAAGPVAPRALGARRGDRKRGDEPRKHQDTSHEANAPAAPEPDLALAGGRRGFPRRGPGTSGAGGHHGTGGVVITSESRRGNGAAAPSRMTADEVTGAFGPDSVLRSMTGVGHAGIEQTTATGAQANRKRRPAAGGICATGRKRQGTREQGTKGSKRTGNREPGESVAGVSEVQSAELDGHVVLFEQAATKPGAQPQPAMHARAGKAVYEGTGEWLHLTLSPRVEDGGLELTADKVDVSAAVGRRLCARQREGDLDKSGRLRRGKAHRAPRQGRSRDRAMWLWAGRGRRT